MLLAGPPILAYHRITPSDAPARTGPFAVGVRQFERQMRYLHEHGYRCMSWCETANSVEAGGRERNRSVVLTFDDGYEDFATEAYPILSRYGLWGIVFLVTDRVGQRSDWEAENGTSLLQWEQIRHLQERGIVFGSHTCTHRRLPDLTEEQAWRELATSREQIEAQLGQQVRWLAYPHGHTNLAVQALAQRAGYQAAFGVSRGKNNRFNILRYAVSGNDTIQTFGLQVAGWYRLAAWLREETAAGRWLRRRKASLLRARREQATARRI